MREKKEKQRRKFHMRNIDKEFNMEEIRVHLFNFYLIIRLITITTQTHKA